MGYNTDFDGYFTIRPSLDAGTLAQLNYLNANDAFLSELDLNWCDWEFENAQNCTIMRWNGSEKSYGMEYAAEAIRAHFFPDATVLGMVRARGEAFDDIWQMVVIDGKIERVEGWELKG